jgi:hypothetical protein
MVIITIAPPPSSYCGVPFLARRRDEFGEGPRLGLGKMDMVRDAGLPAGPVNRPMPAPKVGSASTIALTEFVRVIFVIPACRELAGIATFLRRSGNLADQVVRRARSAINPEAGGLTSATGPLPPPTRKIQAIAIERTRFQRR